MSKRHRPEPHPAPHQQEPASPPGAWWNGIRRLWLIDRDGGPVALDPQPPPPNEAQLVAALGAGLRRLQCADAMAVIESAVLPAIRVDY
jgi:hypothetical protein